MTILLNYYKAKPVDLKEYYKMYDNGSSYKLTRGAPTLINVQGSYIKVGDLLELLIDKRFMFIVNQWLKELKSPLDQLDNYISLTFKWRK